MRKRSRPWTAEDDERLLDNYKRGIPYCAMILRRTKVSITHRLSRLGVVRYNPWGSVDEEHLKRLFPVTNPKRLTLYFNRTVAAIYSKARKLGLRRGNRKPRTRRSA